MTLSCQAYECPSKKRDKDTADSATGKGFNYYNIFQLFCITQILLHMYGIDVAKEHNTNYTAPRGQLRTNRVRGIVVRTQSLKGIRVHGIRSGHSSSGWTGWSFSHPLRVGSWWWALRPPSSQLLRPEPGIALAAQVWLSYVCVVYFYA